MKNLSLSIKVGILVAVLLVTILIVQTVGVVQLKRLESRFSHMVNTTARQVFLTGEGRIELLTAIRSEKNAVLARDVTDATEYADRARQSVDRLKHITAEFESLVGDNLATAEGKVASELGRAVEEFEKSSKELLRLAVMKSNAQGERILSVAMYQRLRELEDFVDSLTRRDGERDATATAPTPSTDAPVASKRMAGRLVVDRCYELLLELMLHLRSADDQEMARLEAKIQQALARLQDALRRFNAVLVESERAEAGSLLTSFDAFKGDAMQVMHLSRVNSDYLARQLSITEGVEVGDRCSRLLDDARKSLKDRIDSEGRDVAAMAMIGQNIVIGTGVLGALVSLVLAVLTIRSITKPVQRGVNVFEALASGDLTQRLNLNQRDEIGRLSTASDQMADALGRVVAQIRNVAVRLSGSSGELASVSSDLVSQSHEMSMQAESVAAATEQMSTNVSTMAAAAEQMSVNISSISSASEEVSVNVSSIVQSATATSRSVGSVAESIARITASLQEVARDAKDGSHLTQQARDMASAANLTMRQLDQAASEITKVTEVIKSIALQTNLLALNATIEATSAGEAGKGFAVVAGEVKELASQSAQSAEDIARKIESVQSSTRQAVTVIEKVAQFVDQVNESAGRISQAVDGQTQTASQIVASVGEARQGVESIARSIAEVGKGATDVSRNTSEAANAAGDVSRNATEGAKAAETISSNIHGVSEATRLSTTSAARLNDSAKQLNDLASELQKIVSRFRIAEQGTAANQ